MMEHFGGCYTVIMFYNKYVVHSGCYTVDSQCTCTKQLLIDRYILDTLLACTW